MIAIIAFITKNIKLLLIGGFVVLILIIAGQCKKNIALRKENARQATNLEQVTKKDGSELTLTVDEFKHINTPVTQKVDSIRKVAKVPLRAIRNAEVTSITYRDTVAVEAKRDRPVEIKPLVAMSVKYYAIPVSINEQCWGMKGLILTTDSSARLKITSRTAINSIQRLEIGKRFLGFLWFTKKSTFKAYTDCGEVKIDKINFVKK